MGSRIGDGRRRRRRRRSEKIRGGECLGGGDG